ncbi:MAG: hypothetical protein RMI45_08345 [Ignisphaera sp.]|nr:hypothetical protein [Ignisphaera sp.]
MSSRYTLKPVRVVCNMEIAKDTYLLEVKPLLYLRERPQPLNFFMIWIPRIDEIPLSIADFDEGRLRFLYKVKGDGTMALTKHCKDMIIGIKGPLGKGIGIKPAPNTRWLVVAGGIGIAPIPYLIRTYKNYGINVDLLWGVKTADEIFNIYEFFPDTKGSKTIIVTEDCRYENGYCGTVIDVLKHIEPKNYDGVIAVGPKGMLKAICLELHKLNPYIGLETLVKCGMGICGSCYVKALDKLLCTDGPVFRCSEVLEHLKASDTNC